MFIYTVLLDGHPIGDFNCSASANCLLQDLKAIGRVGLRATYVRRG